MATLSKPSSLPGVSLLYLTIGVLLAIWSGVWFFVGVPETTLGKTICSGLFLTGLAFLVIGFVVARAHRTDRDEEIGLEEKKVVTNGSKRVPNA